MLPIITTLLPLLGNVLEKVIPNPAEREKAKAELSLRLLEQETQLLKLFTENDKAQLEINKEEVKSGSLFVAGWRPYVGWVCGIGMTWAYVLKPIADWVLAVIGSTAEPPNVNVAELLNLLLALLGMGALRSYEKLKGAAR